MFSLFVSHEVKDQSDGVFTLGRSRFLEHTDPEIAQALRGLSNEAIAGICAWPCILMQEGRAEEPAYLREIVGVQSTADGVSLTTGVAPAALRLTNGQLLRMHEALDIDQWELNRNHWAVKDRDLLAVLADSDLTVDREFADRFVPHALPTVTRAQLLGARDAISSWGHTDIDDLLLEAGVRGLHAGRERGSRRDRANIIVRYVLAHPEATTAENDLLSIFVAQRSGVLGATPVAIVATPAAAAAEAPEEINMVPEAETVAVAVADGTRHSNRVFVVHGRNDDVRAAVATFLQELGLEPIVLHDQPSMGDHLLTKFIREAQDASFAVVLLTDDDVGGIEGGAMAPRARQNVILELGYFLAHLGQRYVCALKAPDVEAPSDFDGIVYISIRDDDAWKQELRRELVAAEMPIARAGKRVTLGNW